MRTTVSTGRLRLGSVLSLLATIAVPRLAGAESISPASASSAVHSTTLAVEVGDGAAGLDATRLRESIAREAGVRVSDAAAPGGPRLVVRGEGEHGLSFELVDTDGRTVKRVIELPEGSETKQLAIAGLVAASLLEDDAADLLAQLRAEAKKAAPPALPPAPPKPRAESKPPAPCTARGGGVVRWFGADVAPNAGMSAFELPGTVRHLSLELFGGGAAGVSGFELSPLVSSNRGFVCGAQVAGLAGFTSGEVRGAQLSGLFNRADRVAGAQGSGILALTTHDVDGAQIAAVTIADRVRGAQAGLVHVAGGVQGAQAGAVNVAGDLQGAQGGVVNVARDVRGAQAGVVNVAENVQGVQVGVVNVARKSDASVGVVSIVTEGRTTLHASIGSDAVTQAAIQHGSRIVHNYYGGAATFGSPDGFAFGPMLGIGFHLFETRTLFSDLDFTASILFGSGGDPQPLEQARWIMGLRITRRFAVYAGPLFDVLFVPTGEKPRIYSTAWETKTGGGMLHLTPGGVIGIRGL